MVLRDHHLPGRIPVRLLAGENDLAGIVLHSFEQNLYRFTRLRRRLILPFA